MKAMPITAAYESWNPISLMDSVQRSNWMKRDTESTCAKLLCLPHNFAVSPTSMNSNARIMDAPAPVAAVYIPHIVMVINARILLAFALWPSIVRSFELIPYMMPRWSPERARMCDAPLSRNADKVSGDIPERSPDSRAEMIWFVAIFLNGIFSMLDFNAPPREII